MINPKYFIYNHAAVARMLGVAIGLVVKVEKWFNCVFVVVKGRRPRFWKKSAFTNHFANWRRKQAEDLKVLRIDRNRFQITNSLKGSIYYVDLHPEGISCNCEDFKNQVNIFKKGCCKHGYAALNQLGFSKLSEYIEHHQWVTDDYEEIDYDEANYFIFGATRW
jgi:SWIM zinc finger